MLVVTVQFPFVRQSDFTNLKAGAQIGACEGCSTIFHCIDDVDIARIDRQFADPAYALTGQTAQTIAPVAGTARATRCALQADLLRSLVAEEPQAILDIGCYDGALLTELSARFPVAELHGFDPIEHLQQVFPQGDRLHLWTSSLEAMTGPFDVITMSHTLMYVRDLSALLRQLDRLLTPDGLLYFQMPDIANNPLSLLMGDQYHYFSEATLGGLLRRFGFAAAPVENPWFPREIAVIARRGGDASPTTVSAAAVLRACLDEVDGKATALGAITETGAVSVLGTTFSAAFVDNVLAHRLSRFVDEDTGRAVAVFRGKPVVHPRQLADGDVLVVPYGTSGLSIQERFAREYRGRTVVV